MFLMFSVANVTQNQYELTSRRGSDSSQLPFIFTVSAEDVFLLLLNPEDLTDGGSVLGRRDVAVGELL